MTPIKMYTRVVGYFIIASLIWSSVQFEGSRLWLSSGLLPLRRRNGQWRIRIERDELAGSRNDHPELFPRNGINSLRIAQRCAFQPELASGLSQLLLLLLGFLDAIAVLDPLVVLPVDPIRDRKSTRLNSSH